MTASVAHRPEPIIPARAAPLRTLTIAMTVMCYLACLAAGALILIDRSVHAWTGDLAREVTVQVRDVEGHRIEDEVKKAIAVLEATSGVLSIALLDEEATRRLLEPWLGDAGDLSDLPIPRLIAVTVDPDAPPDFAALERKLAEDVAGASLDTHRHWQNELTRMARVLMTLAYAILTLICICAVAMVVFATRAALEANREIVAVLHLVGARDRFIARQVWRRFLKTGLTAGIVGFLLGLVTFLLAVTAAPDSFAAIVRDFLTFSSDRIAMNYAVLAAVPVVATLISLVTSRLTLLRILRDLQ
jgi:cell division transport system permease protein